MKRLIVYAGFHKSGTTAIQAALAGQRDSLAKLGVVYPNDYGLFAQHALAKPKASFPFEKAVRAVEHLMSKHETVLLASEFFSEYSAETLNELIERLGPTVSTEAVFSMRRFEKVVVSQYQQLARVGVSLSFDDFCRNLMSAEDPSSEIKLFWQRHSYPEIIGRWADAVGQGYVHVLFVDETHPDFLYSWFEDFIGVPRETLKRETDSNVNRSLDRQELAFVLALRQYLGEKRLEREWVPIFRNRMISTIVSKPSKNPDSQKLALQPSMHKDFVAIAEAQGAAVRNLEVNVHGAWPRPTKPEMQTDASDMVHVDTIAEAIAAIKPENYLRVVSSRAILREIRRRLVLKFSNPFSKK